MSKENAVNDYNEDGIIRNLNIASFESDIQWSDKVDEENPKIHMSRLATTKSCPTLNTLEVSLDTLVISKEKSVLKHSHTEMKNENVTNIPKKVGHFKRKATRSNRMSISNESFLDMQENKKSSR